MMKKPGTEFTLHDVSSNSITVTEQEISPIFLTASSFDKGPEKLQTVKGTEFYSLFGEASFVRHGQPALQAANIINAGGTLLVKRIVADDATLANLIIVAYTKQIAVDKKDPITGAQIYIDAETGAETTSPTSEGGTANEKATINSASIRYEAKTFENIKTYADIQASLVTLYSPNEDVTVEASYPIIVITDNGRGALGGKRFNITSNPALNKAVGFIMYNLNNIGATSSDNEYTYFALDNTKVYSKQTMDLSESSKSLKQINGYDVPYMDEFLGRVALEAGVTEDIVKTQYDVLFGTDIKGTPITQITIEKTDASAVLNSPIGLALQSGTNGSFGDAPMAATATEEAKTAYSTALVNFFKGVTDTAIFDLDNNPIDACFDANYPEAVKKAIFELVEFRKDFFFFRDFGLDINSVDAAIIASETYDKSIYVADYPQAYDVIDPFSRKQVKVSILYSLSALAVDHFNTRRNAPFNGILYDVIINDIVDGTLNFYPLVTPLVDQKSIMMDNRFNYASFIQSQLVMELQLTSQEAESQLSYINNILLTQAIIRKIRFRCPKIRYAFTDGQDGIEQYAKDVQLIIDEFVNQVAYIKFEWTADDVMLASNIFSATISIAHKRYVQSEHFDIFTLSAAPENTTDGLTSGLFS